MKTLRRTCAVAVLSMALAVSAFAGQIGSPGYAPARHAADETSTSTSSITTTIILTIVSLIR